MPWLRYWTLTDLRDHCLRQWGEDFKLAPRWTFHSGGRVITLVVPSGKPNVPPLLRDVALCSSDTLYLLRWLEEGLRSNPSVIWQDGRIESYFWTLWSRCMMGYDNIDLSTARDAVRALSQGTAVDFVRRLSALCSGPHRLAALHLSSALEGRDLGRVLTYAPLCLALRPRVGECYEDYLEWIHRELVFRALGLDNDSGVGDVVACYAKIRSLEEILQDANDRIDEEGWSVFIESRIPSSTSLTPSINQCSNVSRALWPQIERSEGENGTSPRPNPPLCARSSIYHEHPRRAPMMPTETPAVNSPSQECAGSRNDPPTLSRRRRRTRTGVVISEENPAASPSRTPCVVEESAAQRPSFLRLELPPSPLLNAEVFYAVDSLHAVNVLTRVYEGHVLPVSANNPYLPAAIKVITAQGSDAELTLLAWQRDLCARRELLAHPPTRDMVYPAMGVVYGSGGYPDFVSPWSFQGNLRTYMSQRAKEDGFHPDDILGMILELLRVISALHETGIIHGNLKGNNVLVTEDGGLQLCDFGAYRTDEDSQSVPSSTVHDEHEVMLHKSGLYMSPELRYSGRPSAHSDMWAISCVCLELFAAVNGDAADLHSVALRPKSQPWPVRPKYIAKPVWAVLAANWALDPSQRLSASETYSRLASIRFGMDELWE